MQPFTIRPWISLGGALLLFAGLVLVFDLTRGTPNTTELSFAEKGAGLAGAVIPASCESVPPYSHSIGDCPQMCQLSANPDVVNNTEYSWTTNTCVCKNGKSNPPTCDLPNVQVAFSAQGSPNPIPPALAVTFSSNMSQADSGYDMPVLSWNVTGSGVTCNSNGWKANPVTPLPTGTKTVSKISTYRGTAQYDLSCSTASQTITRSVYIIWYGQDRCPNCVEF